MPCTLLKRMTRISLGSHLQRIWLLSVGTRASCLLLIYYARLAFDVRYGIATQLACGLCAKLSIRISGSYLCSTGKTERFPADTRHEIISRIELPRSKKVYCRHGGWNWKSNRLHYHTLDFGLEDWRHHYPKFSSTAALKRATTLPSPTSFEEWLASYLLLSHLHLPLTAPSRQWKQCSLPLLHRTKPSSES